MKANELMIGDWVMYNPNIFIEDEYETTKECYSTRISNGADMDLAIENCYTPIPLTLEIMKANGFNVEVAPYTPNWIRCILNPNFFLEDRLKGFYHFNGNNLAKIQYVHELQHALKLCGIDKNIEL